MFYLVTEFRVLKMFAIINISFLNRTEAVHTAQRAGTITSSVPVSLKYSINRHRLEMPYQEHTCVAGFGDVASFNHALRAKHPAHQLCNRPLGCYMETEDSQAKSQLRGEGCHSSVNTAWLMAAAITSHQQWPVLTTMLWGTITSVGHNVLLFPY